MMNKSFQEVKNKYIKYATNRKNLDSKTIKSYSMDLKQYEQYINTNKLEWQEKKAIELYIDSLHSLYKPKSVKRKIASLKAFFHYLEFEELIDVSPFHRIQVKYKDPFILPKTIPLHQIEEIINYAYYNYKNARTSYSKNVSLRNIVIIELLFATGMRISELCSLTISQINFSDCVIKIYGKGSKERLIQVCNDNVMKVLIQYVRNYVKNDDYLFYNRIGNRLSEQSVRNMINDYAVKSGISFHITPHMFRHSFATLLLEEDVDIRYIQQMLGHSSITTTQIYTHTSIGKQKQILLVKHPRNKIYVD